ILEIVRADVGVAGVIRRDVWINIVAGHEINTQDAVAENGIAADGYSQSVCVTHHHTISKVKGDPIAGAGTVEFETDEVGGCAAENDQAVRIIWQRVGTGGIRADIIALNPVATGALEVNSVVISRNDITCSGTAPDGVVHCTAKNDDAG